MFLGPSSHPFATKGDAAMGWRENSTNGGTVGPFRSEALWLTSTAWSKKPGIPMAPWPAFHDRIEAPRLVGQTFVCLSDPEEITHR